MGNHGKVQSKAGGGLRLCAEGGRERMGLRQETKKEAERAGGGGAGREGAGSVWSEKSVLWKVSEEKVCVGGGHICRRGRKELK